jgi:hypothetical protein
MVPEKENGTFLLGRESQNVASFLFRNGTKPSLVVKGGRSPDKSEKSGRRGGHKGSRESLSHEEILPRALRGWQCNYHPNSGQLILRGTIESSIA